MTLKQAVQKGVQGMRCVALRPGLAEAFAIELAAAVSIAAECVAIRRASEGGRARPRYASGLRFNNHRLLHAARMGCCFNEPGGDARRKRPDLCGAGDLRLNDANCNRKRIGERLRAQRRGALARACGHDGHKLAHPIENDNRDPMRSAEAHSLDRTTPPQPAMTIAEGMREPGSYRSRLTPSPTKSEPPLTERFALSASVVMMRGLIASRASQKASLSASADASDIGSPMAAVAPWRPSDGLASDACPKRSKASHDALE